MGTTFVTISLGPSGDEPGFWMNDGMLELWLRLLALHLPEPNSLGENAVIPQIRDRWLLASRGYFVGCVPHDMEFACSTSAHKQAVLDAIDSLMAALAKSESPLHSDTINLLGYEGTTYFKEIERRRLLDIGDAFRDLLEGRITTTARSTEIMPGSKAYTSKRDAAK